MKRYMDRKQIWWDLCFALLCALGAFAIDFAIVFKKIFGEVSVEQILFHLQFPIMQSDPAIIYKFAKRVGVALIVFVLALIYTRIFSKKYRFIIPVILISIGGILMQKNMHVYELLTYKNTKSYGEFYENHYINPDSTHITAPTKKRNLVLILLESMESTFGGFIGGGLQGEGVEGDFIPRLSHLAQNHLHFSNTHTLGGITQLNGTGWTIAGIVSYMCGFPLYMPIRDNEFMNDSFLSSATCLGDILDDFGYENSFIMGSNERFAGRGGFLKTHKIKNYDYDYYKANGKIPKDYDINWGFEDAKLFAFAKEKLQQYAGSDKPFAMMLLTTDTHAPDGYVDKNICDFEDNYQNAILCSDREVGDFVSWIQTQSFSDDTTIVILGDHLSMKQDFFAKDLKRSVFDVFINSASKTKHSKSRQISHFDMFPTILAALGFEIEGDRLGLGVNLFSDETTLLERLGREAFNDGLDEDSRIYEGFWKQKL